MNRVAVFIPVYNAFDDAVRCIKSVLEHTSDEIEVLVIDDASSDGDFSHYLKSAGDELPDRLTLKRNERNLAFTATVNLGLEALAPADVIILNSDTVVTPKWIEKLSRAAYSSPEIGTVTPFTNNGNIASIPRFCVSNEIPDGYSLEEFAELVERVATGPYSTIPSCVGFCTYIKGELIEKIGLLREEYFPRGYGEENDFSCRAQKAGYIDILDHHTFIYHRGAASFKESQKKLMERGTVVMNRLHPHFFDRVSRFCRSNPLLPLQQRIQLELLHRSQGESRSDVKRVLHILHNGPYEPRVDPIGGTELSVQELIRHLPEVSHWSLTTYRGEYVLEAHLPESTKSWYGEVTKEVLLKLLDREYFSLLHLHHTRWFNLKDFTEALKAHGNYIVSLHDYVLGCPRFHLFTVGGEHCTGKECVSLCGYDKSFIHDYRESGDEILAGAKAVLSFSDSTTRYMNQIFDREFSFQKIQHGIKNASSGKIDRKEIGNKDEPLRVVVPIPRAKHKGSEIVNELLGVNQLPSGREIEWCELKEYDLSTLDNTLRELSPHLGIIISLCPETYGLQIDEFLATGVPLVVGPLGAPAERVKEWRVGWVVEALTKEGVLNLLDQIVSSPVEYRETIDRVRSVPVKSVTAESEEVSELYDKLSSPSPYSIEDTVSYLRTFLGERRAPLTLLARISSKIINTGIYIVDACGVRPKVQIALQSLLPQRVVDSMKRLRI